MKFNEKYKIEKAVTTDKLRPAMCEIQIDKDGKQLVATNGHILAMIPCEIAEADIARRIRPDVITKARKAEKSLPKYQRTDKINLNNANATVTLADSSIVPNSICEDNYPNWQAVIPKIEESEEIALNVELLDRLTDAIGTKSIKIVFDTKHKTQGMKVYPLNDGDNNAWGLLMPLRIKE